MAQSNRQKYNFLAAFVKQLDQARDEQDELAGMCDDVMGVPELVRHITDLEKRLDVIDQWLARLELEMEELDSAGSEGSSEEPDEDDDGDDYADLRRDEPPMGSVRERHGRVATSVDGARERPLAGRSVAKTLRNVRSR